MLFVFLWSTGFIAARAGLEEAGPATFLFLRFSLVSVLMLCLLPVLRPAWPTSPRALAHLVILGLMMQVIYFGGAWMAMSTGVGAGTAALILSLQPVLTALLAGPVLGESLQCRQWLGLGLGVAGVFLVVDHKLALGLGSIAGMVFCLGSLLGITAGTLYQKRFCPTLDVFPGLLVQFITATVIFLPLASLEGWKVTWSQQFVAALVWTTKQANRAQPRLNRKTAFSLIPAHIQHVTCWRKEKMHHHDTTRCCSHVVVLLHSGK